MVIFQLQSTNSTVTPSCTTTPCALPHHTPGSSEVAGILSRGAYTRENLQVILIYIVLSHLVCKSCLHTPAGLRTQFISFTADATNLFCPIGASHNEMKVNFGHCELLNLSMAHRRSPISNVMLAFICLDSTITVHGPAAVVSGTRDPLGELKCISLQLQLTC
jgi:hypothetical protein